MLCHCLIQGGGNWHIVRSRLNQCAEAHVVKLFAVLNFAGNENGRNARSLCAGQHACGRLALGRLEVCPAFAGNNKVCPFQQVVKADAVQDNVRALAKDSTQEGVKGLTLMVWDQ